ncbi:methylenetetrahydromethanopterin reductase [groundwater metagenome]
MGALVNASHPEDFKFAVKLLKEGRSGRDFSAFDVGAYTSFSVASKKEDAQKAAKPVTAFIVAGSPDSVLKKHGLPDNDVKKLRDAFSVSFADAVRAVTPEMMDAFAICGTPEECIEKINGLIKAGVTQVVVGSPVGPDRTEAIKLVGKEIIPYFDN